MIDSGAKRGILLDFRGVFGFKAQTQVSSMTSLCVWSSLSFLWAAVASGHVPLYVLWVLSTLNHMGYKRVRTWDYTLAHTICAWSILHADWNWVYWIMCMWTICVFSVFGLSHLPGLKGELWHASTHVAASIGMVAAQLGPVPPLHFCALMVPMYLYVIRILGMTYTAVASPEDATETYLDARTSTSSLTYCTCAKSP